MIIMDSGFNLQFINTCKHIICLDFYLLLTMIIMYSGFNLQFTNTCKHIIRHRRMEADVGNLFCK